MRAAPACFPGTLLGPLPQRGAARPGQGGLRSQLPSPRGPGAGRSGDSSVRTTPPPVQGRGREEPSDKPGISPARGRGQFAPLKERSRFSPRAKGPPALPQAGEMLGIRCCPRRSTSRLQGRPRVLYPGVLKVQGKDSN